MKVLGIDPGIGCTGYAVLELYLGISNNPSDNVAHFAHLGGALIGIIIVLYWSKKRYFKKWKKFFFEWFQNLKKQVWK